MSLPATLTPAYTGAPRMRSKGPASLPSPLPAAQTAPFEDDKRWKLFVTTNTKVTVWDVQGCNEVFTSGSEGIVAAKRAKDGSVLAIADSQVVVLHKIDEGQDKSYRLKGTQCCHLQYDHDSRSLFFTDAIHNSVQSYSLKENRVADAAKPHPSPITTFAISSDSNLVLSCSADPPIIQIHNRLMATTISIIPRSSSKPVVNCSFHPNRKHIFVLAFGDGVLAAYDYSRISGGNKAKKDGRVGIGHGDTKEIHAFQHLHDPSVGGSSGITGVHFVPGYRSRAVTVGEDGRSFLVDFELRDTLGSWHIGAPATSLSIRPVTNGSTTHEDNLGGYLIAMGTIHGKCYVYDGGGNKVGEQSVDVEGDKVLDVEWVYGDIHLPPNISNDAGPSSKHAKSFTSAGYQQAAANLRHAAAAEDLKPPKTMGEPSKPKHNAEINLEWAEAKETASQGYMKLFSPVKRKPKKLEKVVSLVGNKITETDKVSDPKLRTLEKEDQRGAISAPTLWNESVKKNPRQDTNSEGHDQINKPLDCSHENIATSSARRKTSFQGGLPPSLENLARSTDGDPSSFLALHRISSVTSDIIKTSDKTNDGKLLSQIRSVRAKVGGGKAVRGNLSIFAPYMSNKIKTSAVVRSGRVTEDPKISSPPQENNLDPRQQVLDRNTVGERVDGSGDRIENTPMAEEPQETEAEKEEKPLNKEEAAESDVSFDGDIWLVEEKPSKSRKRKNSLPSNDLPSPSTNSGTGERSSFRTTSSVGSSKSRKTVSWDDGLDHHRNIGYSAFFTHETEPPSSPQFRVSSERSWPLVGATNTQTETSFASEVIPLADSFTKELDNPNNRYLFSGTTSSTEYSFHTPKEATSSEINGIPGLDPALRNALVEVQMTFMSEIKSMKAEMVGKLQAQMNILKDLKSEMRIVREENEKLRNQLSKLNNWEKVKRHQ